MHYGTRTGNRQEDEEVGGPQLRWRGSTHGMDMAWTEHGILHYPIWLVWPVVLGDWAEHPAVLHNPVAQHSTPSRLVAKSRCFMRVTTTADIHSW